MEQQIAAIEAAEAAERGGEGGVEGEMGERDPLFRQAAEVCIQNQLGSTSLLQRRMSIGYGRAARIIDQLEMAGILGPANGVEAARCAGGARGAGRDLWLTSDA